MGWFKRWINNRRKTTAIDPVEEHITRETPQTNRDASVARHEQAIKDHAAMVAAMQKASQ